MRTMLAPVASSRFVGAISSPSERHDGYSGGCRNQKSELPGAHGEVALIPVRRNGGRPGLSIRFLFAEEPIRDFREMPRHDTDSRRMTLASGDALIEATDVAVRVAAAHQTDRVGGFDERPLQVVVDVGAEAPVAQLVPAGGNAAGAAGVAGEFLGGGKGVKSPISSAITTASVSPTPGIVASSWSNGGRLRLRTSADAAMSDDLERENSRLHAQEDNERSCAPDRRSARWASGSHALGSASCLESARVERSGLLAGINRQARLELVAPGGFEPSSQP